jgi:general stress protein YciG
MLPLLKGLGSTVPWFPVDDKFHSHPKVMVTSPAALGLWVVAGSWSSDYGTDGVMRDDQILRLLPDAAPLADELVTAGLWKRIRGGYAFHDWADWGSKRTGKEDKELRAKRAEAGRKGGVASGKSRSKHEASMKQVASAFGSPGLEPQSQSHSLVDVSNPATGSSGHMSRDVIEQVIKSIYERTSRVVDDDWAAKIAGHILGDRQMRNPAGYCRKAIETEPNPQARFLPNPNA